MIAMVNSIVSSPTGTSVSKSGEGAARDSTSQWDVFISHASEDKEKFVTELARELEGVGLRVWFDTHTLKLGDNLREQIDRGLARSRYGIVVLSRAFFRKEWPKRELEGLVQREVIGRGVVLPVWHEVTHEEVFAYSPILAGKVAANSKNGVAVVVREILNVVGLPADLPASAGSVDSIGSRTTNGVLSMSQRATLKTEPDSYEGEITFTSGEVVPYSRTWSGLDGDRIPIGRDLTRIQRSDRRVKLSTVRRIDFLPLSDRDRAELGLRSSASRCDVRKANICFFDNSEYREVYMNTSLWSWYGKREDGSMSDLDIVSMTVSVKV